MQKLTFLIAIVFMLISCKDKEQSNLFYAETKCADSWEFVGDGGDTELVNLVTEYLEMNTTAAFSNLTVNRDNTFAQFCEACSCTTGRLIHIETDEADIQTFIDIGFQKE